MTRLNLLSWNVNGVRAAIKKGAMVDFEILRPDVICLQEIKAKPEQVPRELTEWDEYHAYICSAERPGYSGVACFSKTEPLSVSYGMGEERFDSEGRTLVLEYADFYLINCYFPNGGNGAERLRYKMEFYAAFAEFCASLSKPVIVCGDVNTAHKEIDLARPKENAKNTGFLPMEREWVSSFLDAGYIDSFRHFHPELVQYSWWDMKTRARERNVGWRIDYFFVDKGLKDAMRDAYILPEVLGSDHCPIVLELDI